MEIITKLRYDVAINRQCDVCVTINRRCNVCGDALGVDGGCDLLIVGGACDGGSDEVVKLQNMLVHWQRWRDISVYGMMAFFNIPSSLLHPATPSLVH